MNVNDNANLGMTSFFAWCPILSINTQCRSTGSSSHLNVALPLNHRGCSQGLKDIGLKINDDFQ